MRTWLLAALLVWTPAASAMAQERIAEGRGWDMERAFGEMERLQAEVALLRGLARAQAALLAWNRERAEIPGPYSGAGPAVLAARLCAEPVLAPWCRALPATFGADAAIAADDASEKDGGR